jgi:hypothetical protein
MRQVAEQMEAWFSGRHSLVPGNTNIENFWQKSGPLFYSGIFSEVCGIWLP